jgi:hypothetical protein
MKAKWGAIVVDGRNKIGGHVASKNKSGAYFRTKVTPVNRQTTRQTATRSLLTTISQAWRGLTQAQRDSWNSAVSNFKKTNIFGDIVTPSGFNLFQKLNNNIITLGGTLVSAVPVVASLDGFTAPSLTYTSGTPALSLAFTAAAGTDHGYKIFATAPQSSGKNFVKAEYRLISHGTTTPTSPLDILSLYTAVFGSVGAIGKKIFVKIVPIGAISGVEGLAVATSKISAA